MVWSVTYCVSSSFWGQPNVVDYLAFVLLLDLYIYLWSSRERLDPEIIPFFWQISGQDRPSSNGNVPITPKMNPIPLPNPHQPLRPSDTPVSQQRVVNSRIAGYGASPNHSYDFHSQGERIHLSLWNMRYVMWILYRILQFLFSPASSGVASRGLSEGTYEYSRRVFGSVLNDVSRRADRQPVPYPSY